MSDKNRTVILWLLVIISSAISIISSMPSVIGIAGKLAMAATLVRVLFAVVHGTHRLGWRKFAVIFGITFVVSWCYESLSIATGFPFGHYVYTSELGPKLGNVPLLIMPSYFGVLYLSWVIAHVLLDKLDRQIDSRSIFVIPVIASFIMVM